MTNDNVSPPNGVQPGTASHQDSILQKPIHEERPLKIICVGAGASGLLLAYKLQRSFEKFDLTLYDKNDEISGTWYENKYPGCACDVPAHTYTWSFEPKTDWSSVYAGSDEIYTYFDNFAEKYGLRKYCKLQHEVSGATWNETKGGWDVQVTDLRTGDIVSDYCDFFINASGVLNAWKWPTIPGLENYKGQLLHTARWDTSVDLTGKHVGLIGNGSSAIQVLPAIHSKVNKITTFLRSPAWVSPAQGIEQHIFTEEEQRKFADDPEAHLTYRKFAEEQLNSLFTMFFADSDVQKATFDSMVAVTKEKLKNSDLETKLIPKWAVGCRRITPGIGYLETLGSEKVEIVYGGIQRITEHGCFCEDGQEYPVDVLICATGFDTSYRPRFPIVGVDGKNLAEEWSQEAKSYLGMAVSDFPNYLVIVGPNSPIGNGPVLIAIEAQIDYMLKLIDRWQTENIYSMSPKMEAVDDFIAHKDQFMEKTVWIQECRSWYKNNSASGKVTALWPGSTMHYLEAIAQPRYEDWDIKYKGNRFAYLGNGYSQTERDQTADWAYYIRDHDDSPYLSRGKQRKVETKSGTVDRSSLGSELVRGI
ncbi:hypothetical protein BDQ12DRAFT_649180 [Crucibulum laeve]|uniref:FAD/NAD(P)-binding domain-containing protein n=1 Tax=Crucibulum laeve TaxID=68775 RepID=A0A5C3MF06_9AGAR|nr:hypothetical protein BDQ12DRAFT_649180 [Crucibulum laeve]